MPIDPSIIETMELLARKEKYVSWLRILNQSAHELLDIENDIKALGDHALLAKLDQTMAYNNDLSNRAIAHLDTSNEELNKRFP